MEDDNNKGGGGGGDEGWVDITKECHLATQALDVGEMICGPNFSLFEAMSALELMDPKMDEAMQEPVESITSRLERGALPIQFTMEQGLAIADRLLSCEMAWYDGATLLDSLFVCLYLHSHGLHALCQACSIERAPGSGALLRDTICDPANTITYAVLAMIMGTLKTCHAFRKLILESDIYEEEDCSPNSFGLYLAENLTLEDALYLLSQAETLLLAKDGGGEAAQAKEALLFHLHLRTELILLTNRINQFSPMQAPELVIADGLLIQEACEKCLEALGQIVASRAAAAAAAIDKEGGGEGKEKETPVDASFAFDAGVTRALKGNTPRRIVKFRTPKDAVILLQKVVQDILISLEAFAFEVSTVEQFSLQHLRAFLESFSLNRSPLNIIPRSFLHLHLVQQDEVLLGRFPLEMVIREHMAAIGVPVSVTVSEAGLTFINSMMKTLVDAISILLHNRTRQRTRLEVLFQDLNIMQSNASMMDAKFRDDHGLSEQVNTCAYLFDWTLGETLRSMQHYLLLGLELNLYSDEECDGVLWYLDCILTIRLRILAQMEAKRYEMEQLKAQMMLEEQQQLSSTSRLSNKKKKKGGRKLTEEEARAAQHQHRADDGPLQELQVELNIYRFLCRGSHLFITWLTRAPHGGTSATAEEGGDGIGGISPSPYCPWEERFYHRFKAFEVLQQPILLSYEDFVTNVWSPTLRPEEPLIQAKECFRAIKALVEHAMSLKEARGDERGKLAMRELARTAVTSSVSLAQAERKLSSGEGGGGKGKRGRAKLVYSAHKQLPVVNYVEGR